MAQPHVREPAAPPPAQLPAAAAAGGAGADLPPPAAAGGEPGGGPAAGEAAGELAACWVPDVMRCRWRRDPAQARLLPRLRANLRAMAILALVLAVAASNSLLVPMALERLPATSARADQILRFRRELTFLVTAGRRADTALWYQRVAAAAAASDDDGSSADDGPNSEGDVNSSISISSAGEVEPSGSSSGGGGSAGAGAGEGAAGFLAAALEGSSNSSRLEAKLAVWSSLWRPLLPPHWLRAVLSADASQVAGLDPALLSALQWEEHPQSAPLAAQLHAAANNPSAVAAAAAALQRLVHHPEEAGTILPLSASSDRRGQAGSPGTPPGSAPSGKAPSRGGDGASGGDASMVHLLLMASMAAGIDAKSAPLQLAATRALTSLQAAAAAAGSEAAGAALTADLRWLRSQQALYAGKLALLGGDASWQVQQRMAPLYRLLQKHGAELERMRSPDHKRLIPLVEVSLAIMRLSCERFFSLLAVFLGFLLFRDPPPAARRAIRAIAAFSAVFQRLVLFSFPAICWAYGAGALFSSFVSIVFWTGPLVRVIERVRNAATSVQPRQWHAATPEEVERMGGQCAICWGDMPLPGGAAATAASAAATAGAAAEGSPTSPAPAAGAAPASPPLPASAPSGAAGSMALPCGHAYHRECLQQWLQQCYGQARSATCPMCQASIALRVRYRMPWQRALLPAAAGEGEGAAGGGGGAAAEGIPGLAALAQQLQEDFRARFEPMLDAAQPDAALLQAALALDDAQRWPPADAIIPPPPLPAHGLPPWWPEGGDNGVPGLAGDGALPPQQQEGAAQEQQHVQGEQGLQEAGGQPGGLQEQRQACQRERQQAWQQGQGGGAAAAGAAAGADGGQVGNPPGALPAAAAPLQAAPHAGDAPGVMGGEDFQPAAVAAAEMRQEQQRAVRRRGLIGRLLRRL